MTIEPQPVDEYISYCAGMVPTLEYTSIPLIASGGTSLLNPLKSSLGKGKPSTKKFGEQRKPPSGLLTPRRYGNGRGRPPVFPLPPHSMVIPLIPSSTEMRSEKPCRAISCAVT